MAVLETCFVTGLVVPSGVATSVGTVLAGEGVLAYPEVAVAALAGGWLGDSLGFWIGRRWGEPLVAGTGWIGRSLRRGQRASEPFFGRHPLFSVSLARLVSFVRTVMPMAAGMSRLPYRHFLLYEALGLTAWVAAYMSIGAVAGESWRMATSAVGLGWTLIFLMVGVVLWVRVRRRARTAPGGEA